MLQRLNVGEDHITLHRHNATGRCRAFSRKPERVDDLLGAGAAIDPVGGNAELIVLIEDHIHLLRLLKGLPAIERIVVPADFDEAIGHESDVFCFNSRHHGELNARRNSDILVFGGNDHLSELRQIPHR